MPVHYAGTVSRASSAPGTGQNSQENRLLLTASGVGTRSPTWTIAASWEKALNLHPSKCQVPNHSWVDWWGWCEADGKSDGKSDGKLPDLGLNLGTSGPEPRTQQPHHTATTHIQIHTHTDAHTYPHTYVLNYIGLIVPQRVGTFENSTFLELK